jgi:hypothetical protein
MRFKTILKMMRKAKFLALCQPKSTVILKENEPLSHTSQHMGGYFLVMMENGWSINTIMLVFQTAALLTSAFIAIEWPMRSLRTLRLIIRHRTRRCAT